MSAKRRAGYSYSLDDSLGSSRRNGKSRGVGRIVAGILLLGLLGGLLYLGATLLFGGGLGSLTPFSKNLVAVRMQHNGQEVILVPDSQCVVNPRDSLQLLEVQTDGWLSWGTKIVSSEVDLERLRQKPVAIRELLPQEDFETPKGLELRTLVWNRPIGKVSFLVQLDAKDWLQKANAATDPDRKITYLERALRENAGNVLVKTQLAGLYFDAKRFDDAARLYREINESGKSKSILERLLAVYQKQGKVEDALATHIELLRLSDEPEAFKDFLEYLQKSKSREEAGRYLERHQQEIPKAFQSSLLLYLADVNTQTKNWSKAAASYEKAIRAGVKDPDVLYNLAVTYQQGDDPDKAIPALERYLKQNPGDMKSWMQLGALQEKKGAAAQARATYETVLQRNPQHKEALLRLVAILEKSNDKSALQGAYEKLLQAQPKNRTVQYNLGVLYYEAKKWDKAVEAFEAIAAADSKDVESRKYLLDLYRKQKNEKGEMEMLQTLAQLEPKNTSYYDALFSTYDAKKDYKAIVALFRGVAEQAPDSVSVHNYLLYGLLKSGDNKGALRELEQLVRLQPKEKKHLRQAANLYESTGNYAEASKKVEQLLKLDPNDKDAKENYMRLKMLMISKKKPS